jgi:predicted transcriptional regulator of viral defense system
MRLTEAYADLRQIGRPVITTAEAATRWGVQQQTAGKRLRAIVAAGLALSLRRGLWSLDRDLDPTVLPPYLTSPLPAYVSLFSALASHDMIEQIPGRVSVASLDRARTIVTSLGVYSVHHLAPELFGGFAGSEETGYLAGAEKALFDTVYVRAAAGSRAYFPELTLTADFDQAALAGWTQKIKSRRLRTLVSRQLAEVVASSEAYSPAVGGAVGSLLSSPRPSRAM